MKERRYDKIMRMISEGYSDEEIIKAVKRRGELKAEMNIDVYRTVHDGKTCFLAQYGPDAIRRNDEFPLTDGCKAADLAAWMHGVFLKQVKANHHSSYGYMNYDTPSYDH